VPKVEPTERGEWYFQRYVEQLPSADMVVFVALPIPALRRGRACG
jgi:polyphosphate kinase 2 (PPK2 family)